MKFSRANLAEVGKNVGHPFHASDEELTLLVFFAPAEYSNR